MKALISRARVISPLTGLGRKNHYDPLSCHGIVNCENDSFITRSKNRAIYRVLRRTLILLQKKMHFLKLLQDNVNAL